MNYGKILSMSVESGIMGKILNKTKVGKKLVNKALKTLYGEQVGRTSEYGVRVFRRADENGRIVTTALDKTNNPYFKNIKIFNDNGQLVESVTHNDGHHATTQIFYDKGFVGGQEFYVRHSSWRDAYVGALDTKAPHDVRTSSVIRERVGSKTVGDLTYNTWRDTVEVADLSYKRGRAYTKATTKEYQKFGGIQLKCV